MKVQIERTTPEPPPPTYRVTFDVTDRERELLRAYFGAIGTNHYVDTVTGKEPVAEMLPTGEYLPITPPTFAEFGLISDALYAAFERR